jgi:hypothetical protein
VETRASGQIIFKYDNSGKLNMFKSDIPSEEILCQTASC